MKQDGKKHTRTPCEPGLGQSPAELDAANRPCASCEESNRLNVTLRRLLMRTHARTRPEPPVCDSTDEAR